MHLGEFESLLFTQGEIMNM